MKKKILIILIIILFTTGCNCEYNLTITDDSFKENVKLIGNTSDEIKSFNNKWSIPVDKNEYNRPGDPDSTPDTSDGVYQYELSSNSLIFTNDFTLDNYSNSSAVSVCYKNLTVINYGDSIIISSSNEVDCFNRYPTLNNLTINVTVDKPVTNHNADSVNGQTYTWNLNKNNNTKSINLVIENKEEVEVIEGSTNNDKETNEKEDKDKYTLYIVLGIILVIFLLIYFTMSMLINKKDDMDD